MGVLPSRAPIHDDFTNDPTGFFLNETGIGTNEEGEELHPVPLVLDGRAYRLWLSPENQEKYIKPLRDMVTNPWVEEDEEYYKKQRAEITEEAARLAAEAGGKKRGKDTTLTRMWLLREKRPVAVRGVIPKREQAAFDAFEAERGTYEPTAEERAAWDVFKKAQDGQETLDVDDN